MALNRTCFVVGGFLVTSFLFPCAIDTSPTFHPVGNAEDSANLRLGKLGLITPDLAEADELIAYRYLSGLTLDPTLLNSGRKQSVVLLSPSFSQSPAAQWATARNGQIRYINPYRQGRFLKTIYYLDCMDDAFTTATQTLDDRRQSYHDDALVAAWAEAQDQVFANCSDNPATTSIPAEPAAGLPALAKADRLYQIAAAHFYAEDFDEAAKRFGEIAQDGTSPWRHTAAYMVGRTLMREFTLENKAGAADAARAAFQKFADDPDGGSLRDSARGLIERLNSIDHAPEVMQSLSGKLMAAHADAGLAGTIEQARYVLVADAFKNVISKPDLPEPFDWVHTLDTSNGKHALERWQSTQQLPWLTLALVFTPGSNSAAPDLIAAADKVPADSPAWVTVSYHALRMRVERGETDGPRAQLDKMLAKEAEQTASVRNAWRELRMRVADSFDDLLHWAPREPTNADEMAPGPEGKSPVLGPDSVEILNFGTPLTKIAVAASSPRIPEWSAARVALMGWTRAFVLGDDATMRKLAPLVSKEHAAWTVDLMPPTGGSDAAWRFRTALFVERNADLTPLLSVDFRKPLMPDDGWWCAAKPPNGLATSHVFSEEEQAESKQELDRLTTLGSGQAVLGPIVLDWAKSHPSDPLVPEALYRAVRVVRYGCFGDPKNGEISKAAFDLLHRKYPQSPWTAKTPYWFK